LRRPIEMAKSPGSRLLQQKRDEAEVVADMVVLVEEHRLIAGMAAVRRRRSDIRPGA
jgi:hypothetical protein